MCFVDYVIKRDQQPRRLTDTGQSHTLMLLVDMGEGKGSSTHIALKRLLPGVSPLVLVQAPFLAEGFAALRALVWLFLESMERDCCERGGCSFLWVALTMKP